MTTIQALTPQQQKLVADNHNLIYGLAYEKNINLDEFYGELAIALCMAALAFDENRGSFSTLAYTAMYNRYKFCLRAKTRQKIVPQNKIFSIDVPVPSVDSNNAPILASSIPDETVQVEQAVMENMTYDVFMEKLTDRERVIFKMLMDGGTQVDVAKHFGCSKAYICNCVKKMRNKLQNFIQRNPCLMGE